MRTLALLLSAASAALALPHQPAQEVFALPTSLSSPFTTASHPHHPNHRIRLRHPQGLCDSVNQTSGYLDTARGHHAFFWAFESRNDPKNDPVVVWINGGPGCSSATGLLQELGPCRAQKEGEPKFNPYSWTNNATVIFLDQPTGVGFSYGDKGAPKVWTTEAAAEDFYAFLHIFFETFAGKYGNSDLHIAGESYAGRYLPVFADYIVKQNEKAEANGVKKINLKSVLIGNGFTNPLIQYESYLPALCTSELGGPYVDEAGCRKMQEAWPRCKRLMEACWGTSRASSLCMSAYRFCETRMTAPYDETGRSPYNFDKYGEYEENEWIERWLNRDDVREELGVDEVDSRGHKRVKKFEGCSDKVFERFEDSADGVQPSFRQVASLLDNDVDVLIYVGAKDMICNIKGNEAWTLDPSFEWSGAEEFRARELGEWYATPEKDAGEGEVGERRRAAGRYRQVGGLAFAGVEGAGHFVPYDKPVEALALFNRWIFERTVGYQ
ncbi:hypothetical protein JCM8097_001925 [Rhodosporidiobolus ruineniae]